MPDLFGMPYLSGLVAALLTVAILRILPSRWEHRAYAAALFLAAVIYARFAVSGNADPTWTAAEVTGIIAYLPFAVFGLKWPRVLAAGWMLHVAWDLAHLGGRHAFVPEGYPEFCGTFDLVVAAAILWRARAWASIPPHPDHAGDAQPKTSSSSSA